jgi:hypothetical protein
MDLWIGNLEAAVVRHPLRTVAAGFIVGFLIGWVVL